MDCDVSNFNVLLQVKCYQVGEIILQHPIMLNW